MLRSVLTPKTTDVHIVIPEEYVGKKMEVILFSENEVKTKRKKKPATFEKYIGILSTEEAEQLRQEVKQSRTEWERNI